MKYANTKHNSIFFNYLIVIILPLFLLGCTSNEKHTSIKNGILNINNNSFSKKSELRLHGKILLYWKQWPLDKNGTFSKDFLHNPDTLFIPSGLWTSVGKPSRGYGTYRFWIKRNEIEKDYIINIPRVLGAVEIWINGKKIVSHGKVSKSPENEIANGQPLRVTLPKEKLLDIMLVTSNYKHRLGGGIAMLNTIQKKEYFEARNKTKPLTENLVTFLVIIFGIFQVVNYFSFPKYKFFLYFGLFCLFGGSRQLFVGENLIYNFFPNISFEIVQRMRYIGYYGGLASAFLYQTALFPGYIHRKLIFTSVLMSVLGVIFVLFAPVYYTTLSAPIFQILGLITISLGLYQMILAVRDKKPFALEVGISLFVASLLLANDLLNAMMIIYTDFFINYGLLAYVFFQMIVNRRIQKKRELDLVKLSSSVEELSSKIDKKQEEISELRSESYKQIKSKEKLVENLKKVVSNDETISIQNIIADLRSELVGDSQLVTIKNNIEELNQSFFDRIKEIHPNLTKTDLEICSYLRISLGRQEIARLRFTSVEAVKKSRNRLRKKMNLSEEMDLEEYLKSI